MMNRYLSSWTLLVVLVTGWFFLCIELYGQPLRVTSESAAKSEAHVNALTKAGQHWAAELKQQEAKLDESFKRLNQAISLMKVDKLSGTRLAIIEVRQIVRELREKVDIVVVDHEAVLAASKSYRQSIEHIRPLLLTAAGTFAEYAREEPYESLREDYFLWAELFRSIATKYERSSSELEPAVQAVADNLDYVKRTSLMLERLERLLAIPPDDGADAEIFLRRLASYVQSFERFREQLRKLHGAVADDAPKQVDPQPSQEEATRGDATAAAWLHSQPTRWSPPIKARLVSHPSGGMRHLQWMTTASRF